MMTCVCCQATALDSSFLDGETEDLSLSALLLVTLQPLQHRRSALVQNGLWRNDNRIVREIEHSELLAVGNLPRNLCEHIVRHVHLLAVDKLANGWRQVRQLVRLDIERREIHETANGRGQREQLV